VGVTDARVGVEFVATPQLLSRKVIQTCSANHVRMFSFHKIRVCRSHLLYGCKPEKHHYHSRLLH